MLGTVVLGLASRRGSGSLAPVFGKYPGDALWCLMVFFGIGVARPAGSTIVNALLAFAISLAVELLKLWQWPMLVAFRHTTFGHLVLGHAFSWQNLLAYATGAAGGVGIELAVSALASSRGRSARR